MGGAIEYTCKVKAEKQLLKIKPNKRGVREAEVNHENLITVFKTWQNHVGY